jgi:hypothetical protein
MKLRALSGPDKSGFPTLRTGYTALHTSGHDFGFAVQRVA